MELPTNTLPTSPRELAQLAKEQTLGEAKYLGCPRFEAQNSITTAVSSGPTKISGQNRKFERQPSHNNRDHNPERSNHSTHSHNTGRHHNNLNLDMET